MTHKLEHPQKKNHLNNTNCFIPRKYANYFVVIVLQIDFLDVKTFIRFSNEFIAVTVIQNNDNKHHNKKLYLKCNLLQ